MTRPFMKPFFEIFPTNNRQQYQWPVNQALLEEIIRENQYNHYIDGIRNGRRLLDFCSRMHETPEFISPGALLPHIRRVNQCLKVWAAVGWGCQGNGQLMF